MARIAGVDIPREKRLEVSLTYIYGIGRHVAQEICARTDVDPNTRVRDLTDEEVTRLRNDIDANLRVEGDLRRDVSQDIKRKMEINCYQGVRHRKGLPVHGQRTHTNARTRKGPEEDGGRKEEGPQVDAKADQAAGRPPAPSPGAQERRPTAWPTSRARSTTPSSSIADPEGNVLAWASAGNVGFKGSRKSTPFAAQLAAEACARRAMEHGVRKVDVLVRGPGLGT